MGLPDLTVLMGSRWVLFVLNLAGNALFGCVVIIWFSFWVLDVGLCYWWL